MEIVDAQVHLNQLVPDWRTAETDAVIATAVVTMDAVGIDAVLIAESRGMDANLRPALGTLLPNGAVRSVYPLSERAVALHPDRFAYLMRVDHTDPDLERLVAEVRTTPGALCLRVVPIVDTGAVDEFERGAFEPLFDAAERAAVPIFAWLPGRAHMLERYLRAFPKLPMIIDHTGVGVEPPRRTAHVAALSRSVVASLDTRLAQFNAVLEMAQYANLAMKWSQAPLKLSAEEYPYRDVVALLRRAIDAFGVERIMWASDYTQIRANSGGTWADELGYLRDSDQLSETEKAWLLGRSVRQVLRWPAPTAGQAV
jgi:L-fuconolactonase